MGLREAIALREKALTLGSIAHHGGQACDGGALVGSDKVREWFAKRQPDIDLRKLPFAKYPARDAYFNSLVNLGLFVTEDDLPDLDAEAQTAVQTFDDLELSGLGNQLAEAYGSLVRPLKATQDLASVRRRCTVASLREFGKRGGLCELTEAAAPDRRLLRDIFLARLPLKGESHQVRKRSPLLILSLCHQLSAAGQPVGEEQFASATFFGEVVLDQDGLIGVNWPEPLLDIATRWRMFYFQHYMSVALEGMFAWLVTQLAEKGLAGASVRELAEGLDSATVRRTVAELLNDGKSAARFGQSTPSRTFQRFTGGPGELDASKSRALDGQIRPTNAMSEARLESAIRSRAYLQSATGLALPMLLLAVTLGRYTHWEATNYGQWLAGASNDPY